MITVNSAMSTRRLCKLPNRESLERSPNIFHPVVSSVSENTKYLILSCSYVLSVALPFFTDGFAISINFFVFTPSEPANSSPFSFTIKS